MNIEKNFQNLDVRLCVILRKKIIHVQSTVVAAKLQPLNSDFFPSSEMTMIHQIFLLLILSSGPGKSNPIFMFALKPMDISEGKVCEIIDSTQLLLCSVQFIVHVLFIHSNCVFGGGEGLDIYLISITYYMYLNKLTQKGTKTFATMYCKFLRDPDIRRLNMILFLKLAHLNQRYLGF